jgi:hypothetical protein
MPDGADTYLHRVGRAGRFGTKGLGITFVSSAGDSETLNQVQERFEVNITELPETIDPSTYSKLLYLSFKGILQYEDHLTFCIIFPSFSSELVNIQAYLLVLFLLYFNKRVFAITEQNPPFNGV